MHLGLGGDFLRFSFHFIGILRVGGSDGGDIIFVDYHDAVNLGLCCSRHRWIREVLKVIVIEAGFLVGCYGLALLQCTLILGQCEVLRVRELLRAHHLHHAINWIRDILAREVVGRISVKLDVVGL